jgi:polyhydroxyalkanoate synthesis regulator phasin
MNIIDVILNKLGLQRKSIATLGTPPPQKEENSLMASIDKQIETGRRATGLVSDSVENMLAAMYEQKAAAINEFAEKIRSGKLTKEENESYMQALFGSTNTTELSPKIQQALRDALEKRGREDEDESV